MRNLLATTACLLLGSTLAACAVPAPDSSAPEAVDAATSPIIAGTPDTTHTAVVAVLSESSACTGTIVKVDGSVGYVLTAAHCCEYPSPDPPVVVVQGNDYYVSGAKQYNVLDYKAHTGYDYANQGAGSPYDFCMVKIGGTTASTPVIPVLPKAKDNLAAGSTVTLVGYGLTDGMTDNSVRRKATAKIEDINSVQFAFSYNPGGICSGDSGGPALYTVGGVEYVAGVASFSDEYCTEYGGEGRVSAVVDSFVNTYIAGQPATLSCNECLQTSIAGSGSCVGALNTCTNDSQCGAFLDCINGCSTDSCTQACADKYPAGLPKYFAIFSCSCDAPCKTECKGDTMCQDLPGACYYDFGDTACGTCTEGSCCAQSAACANDDTCAKCVTGVSTSGCSTNTAYKNLASCQDTSCGAQCGDEETTTSSSSSSSSGSSSNGAGGGGTESGAGGGSTQNGVGGGSSDGAGGSSSTGTIGNWTPGGDEEEDTSDPNQSSGCSAAPSGAPASSAGWIGGAALALTLAVRRRR